MESITFMYISGYKIMAHTSKQKKNSKYENQTKNKVIKNNPIIYHDYVAGCNRMYLSKI